MKKSNKTPPSIAALSSAPELIPGGGIEAGLQEKFKLKGQADARRQAYELQQSNDAAAHPMQGLHPLPEGDVGSEWSPFFESLQQQGATIGAKKVDAMPGLTTDPAQGTLPLSMQGLQGATYGYDGTRPTSVRFGGLALPSRRGL